MPQQATEGTTPRRVRPPRRWRTWILNRALRHGPPSAPPRFEIAWSNYATLCSIETHTKQNCVLKPTCNWTVFFNKETSWPMRSTERPLPGDTKRRGSSSRLGRERKFLQQFSGFLHPLVCSQNSSAASVELIDEQQLNDQDASRAYFRWNQLWGKNAERGGRWCIDRGDVLDPPFSRFPLVGDGEGCWLAEGDHPVEDVAGDDCLGLL